MNPTETCTHLRKGLEQNSRPYEWRIRQLRALQSLLLENDESLCAAMWKDLRKSRFECQATEQGLVLSEIALTLKNLKKWMRLQKVRTPLYNQPGRSHIVREPYGLTLIIGAWNYPINLTLAPLVGAIAGGNAAIIKPSEIAANTAQLLAQLVEKYLDPNLIAVVQGGIPETDALLDQPFDKIFFTGSGPVGKIILAKAAVHLTPVTLELGGKSPALVLKSADIAITGRRLAWGKFMNAGQTCVAPDYVLCEMGLRDPLVESIKTSLAEFYDGNVAKSPDYCRIINEKNFARLEGLVKGLPILHGGEFLRDELFISPTIVSAVADSAIMREEIFGPILPILEMKDVSEMISFVNSRAKPLALYLFTTKCKEVDQVSAQTSSGGVCVNDVVMHMPCPSLPFGGVGASGMGNYHGEFSFRTFTHAKGILKKTFWLDLPIRYAPYSKIKARGLRWLFS